MNSSMTKDLNVACVSDIHLIHKRNDTKEIISALEIAFPDNSETGNLDIIFVAGDVFDGGINLYNESVPDVDLWIMRFLKMCSKRNIIVRILEGTPSHDKGQSKRFETINELANLNANVKYVNSLSVEYFKKFNINVLYIPDEWTSSTDKTLEEAKQAIRDKHLSQVDFAIMHGQFEHQLPTNIKSIPFHNREEYLKLVKHYVFIGHVHNHTFFDRIIAQGSFDRLAHGEEEPKGHIRATITPEGDRSFFFIENKLARIYKTLKCTNKTIEETLIFIKNKVNKYPANACVRIEATNDHPILSNMDMLIRMYPTITWSKLVKKIKVTHIEETETDKKYEPFFINRNNIQDLLINRLKGLNLPLNTIVKAQEHLKAVIEND